VSKRALATPAESRDALRLLSEARERTDALLEAWAERVQAEVPGRDGEALAYAHKHHLL
jgi:hypothetical protein